jgi:hypothetical protein
MFDGKMQALFHVRRDVVGACAVSMRGIAE